MATSPTSVPVFHTVVLLPLRDPNGVVVDARIESADQTWRNKVSDGADPTGESLLRYLRDDGSRIRSIAEVADTGVSQDHFSQHPKAPHRTAVSHLRSLGDRVLMVGYELTEDRSIRAALEETRAELVAAQRLAQMGSWVWDPRSDTATWSETMLAIYGLAPGSPTPSFTEQARFYDPETIAQTTALIERVMRTGEPYSAEYDITRDDGQKRHVIAHGESMHVDGAFAGLRGTVVDITELHRTREALRRSERQLVSVLDSVGESVALLRPERDASGEIRALYVDWVNAAWHAVWQFEGEVVGRDAYELGATFRSLSSLHREVLDGKAPQVATITRADGGVVELTLTAMGGLIVAVGRDVTAQRRAEEQREQRRRADQIVALASGLAHQLNNLLALVVGHTELLADRVRPEDQESVAAILSASERASILTNHLLAYAGRQALVPSEFELGPFLDRLAPVLRAAAGPTVELAGPAPGSGVFVRIDPKQLELMLVELIRNARRAMPAGGRIALTIALSPPFVLLTVADSGRGIAAEHLARIFDPFFTGHAFGESPGLGLSSVQGTMTQSGGRVSVQSEVGRGAAFTLHIPHVPARSTAQVPRAARSMTGEKPRVLVVDDDVRRVVSRILVRRGYAVTEAAGPNEALATLAMGDFDVLLTDVQMPVMTGRALADEASVRKPQMRVVYMSGYAASALEKDGALPSDALFLPKPFSGTQLSDVLDRALFPVEGALPRSE